MPYAMLYFYRPADADKLYLELCDDHQEMMKDGYYWDKWDFFYQNRKLVNKCLEMRVLRHQRLLLALLPGNQERSFPILAFFHARTR